MWVYKPFQGFGEWHRVEYIPNKRSQRTIENVKTDGACNSFGITYTEPTPTCYHSYGLDHECVLRRSNEIHSRRHQLLLDRLPPLPSNWEKKQKTERLLDPTPPPPPVVTFDPRDPAHHSESWPMEKESQAIGWFADKIRLPKSRFRDWPKNFSFV
ncbi:hypothetical protein RRG08_026476 [Elysia crispata]|uniref:Uncharacterized protein n=1 Tax=Elysia crispata TaxID=231223 RepID=A0AAE0Y4A0_9GAST|nr:hypothetical protein RRG08_026476 [Elysia crispata]